VGEYELPRLLLVVVVRSMAEGCLYDDRLAASAGLVEKQ